MKRGLLEAVLVVGAAMTLRSYDARADARLVSRAQDVAARQDAADEKAVLAKSSARVDGKRLAQLKSDVHALRADRLAATVRDLDHDVRPALRATGATITLGSVRVRGYYDSLLRAQNGAGSSRLELTGDGPRIVRNKTEAEYSPSFAVTVMVDKQKTAAVRQGVIGKLQRSFHKSMSIEAFADQVTPAVARGKVDEWLRSREVAKAGEEK